MRNARYVPIYPVVLFLFCGYPHICQYITHPAYGKASAEFSITFHLVNLLQLLAAKGTGADMEQDTASKIRFR